jgi:hypothetical protein
MPAKEEKNGHIAGAPEGWVGLKTDRPLYQGERGKGDVIQGVLLGMLTMPPANGKPWDAFIVRLTAPCRCLDREKKPVTAQAGDEILVPANHQLSQHLGKAANHPSAMFEVWIKPKGQTKTKVGSMTLFEIAVNPQAMRRGGHERMLAMQAQAPALPAHATPIAEDDIPF